MSVRWLIFSFVVVLHFSLAAVEDRKDWLRAFKAGTHADYNVESVTYESFINKELILFSVSIIAQPLDVSASYGGASRSLPLSLIHI